MPPDGPPPPPCPHCRDGRMVEWDSATRRWFCALCGRLFKVKA